MKKETVVLKNILCLAVATVQMLSQQTPTNPGASVAGSLVGNDGIPIVGGLVRVSLVSPTIGGQAKRPPERHYGAPTGPGGTFVITGLQPGTYAVCGSGSAKVWLGSCDWGSKPAQVAVKAGSANTIRIGLRKGAAVPIRVEDPVRSLSQNERITRGAHLLPGVAGTDRLLRPAVLMSQDSGGRNYQSLIPFDTPVKLLFSSSFFQLADERGTPLQARTNSMTVVVPSGKQPSAVRLVVTGVRAQ